MTETSFVLSWEPSEKDGGTKIIEYIVEMREATKKKYVLLGTTAGNTTYIEVNNVTKDSAYKFKIYARNEAGTSDPLESDDKIIAGRRISKFSFLFQFAASFKFAY